MYHWNVIALSFIHRKVANITQEAKKSKVWRVLTFLNAPISKFYYDVVSKKCTVIFNLPCSSFLWPERLGVLYSAWVATASFS